MKKVIPWIILSVFFACKNEPTKVTETEPTVFDWQGHRGCRGLIPENTLLGFTNALDFPKITTLEMDVVITADKEVIISHDPYMSGTICTRPDGTPVPKEDEKSYNIYEMNYSEVRKFDCGRRPHPDFPKQQNIPAFKPKLSDIFLKITQYCEIKKRPLPYFNIELKSMPSRDQQFHPVPEEFVALVLAEVEKFGHPEKVIIQSFDARILQEVKKQAPNIKLAWLTENPNYVAELKEIGFTPDIYSPSHILLSRAVVETMHEKGMKVIPWTVNDPERMAQLIEFGVDGIITDYPNQIPK